MPGPIEPNRRRLAAALRRTGANMAAAGRLLGCTRDTVWRRVQRSPELQKLCEQVLEESKDTWEAKLEELGVEKDNVTAVLALLNAKARDRGYGYSRTDVHVSGSVDHHHLHLHTGKFAALDDDQLARLIEERRAELAREDAPPMNDVTPSQTGREDGGT